jgi:hypothetical protein
MKRANGEKELNQALLERIAIKSRFSNTAWLLQLLLADYENKLRAKDINKKERNLRETETKVLRNQKPKYKKMHRERRSEIRGERLCTKGK